MNQPERKCVMVIDANLPLGLIANTATMLGISIGQLHPEIVGEDVTDGSGKEHPGISMVPISMLKGDEALLKDLRARLFEQEFAGLTAVDFSDVAQSCRTYDEFISRAAAAREEDITYLGIGIWGTKKQVNRLTGSLPLLR